MEIGQKQSKQNSTLKQNSHQYGPKKYQTVFVLFIREILLIWYYREVEKNSCIDVFKIS